MDQLAEHPASEPAFEKCVQCGYSLKGLPADHACPECGLRFDERCELYRFPVPKKMYVVLALAIVGGSVQLLLMCTRGRLDALVGLFCVWWIPFTGWFLYRLCRRGQQVAITTDGLMVRMCRRGDGFIPWNEIAGATRKREPLTRHRLAIVSLRAEWQTRCFGGVLHPFPTHDHVERFVSQVNERVGAPESPDPE